MLRSSTHSGKGFFSAEELSMLEELFDELCTSSRTDSNSPAATRLAKALIAAFDHGIRERDNLISVVCIAGPTPAGATRIGPLN